MMTPSSIENAHEDLKLFDNLKGLLTPQEVGELLGMSKKTVYDWKYRAALREVPTGLFVKFNRKLFIRTDVLKKWILSQNQIS